MHRARTGFTLLELLVVVTVIVILIAMLAPALDKAVDEAMTAADGARHDASAATVTQYAFDHKRSYPTRGWMIDEDVPQGMAWQTKELIKNGIDERAPLVGYMPLNKMWNDPFSQTINMETIEAENILFKIPTVRWYGWKYEDTGASGAMRGGQGMMKLGDRFSYTDGQGVTHSFSVIQSDDFTCTPSGNNWESSHPGTSGAWVQLFYEESFASPYLGRYDTRASASYWQHPGGGEQEFSKFNNIAYYGTINVLYAMADGSVQRFNNVHPSSWTDTGLTYAPWRNQMSLFPGPGTVTPNSANGGYMLLPEN